MRRKTTALLAFCALALAACSPSPASLVSDFHKDVSDGNIEQALSMIDLQQATGLGFSEGKIRAALTSQSQKYNGVKCGGVKKVDIKNEEVRGDIAVIKYDVICKSGMKASTDSKDNLAKVNGKWRIAIKL